MSRELSRTSHSNYGSTSTDDPQVGFSGENRELRMLCDNISTNLYTINSSTKSLQTSLSTLGTAKDNQGLRDQIHVWQLSANEVIKATSADVAKLSRVARSASKGHKLQAEKITNHFKEAVQCYGKVQLSVADKLRRCLPRTNSAGGEGEDASLVEAEERQQLQLQQQLQFETDMAAERQRRVQEIESDILDVNQLMRELGAFVQEQAEQIDTIESHIESSRGNVEAGASQIQRAANYQNKARRSKLCILGFLVVGLVILISVIVWSSR